MVGTLTCSSRARSASVLAVERHVGDDILFYQNILMGDTLQGFVLLLIEKILKKHRLVFK